MTSEYKVLAGCTAEVFLALAARRLLSAALAIGKTSAQVPSLGALSSLANEAMALDPNAEQEFFNTFNTLANLFGLDASASDLLLMSLAAELDERVYSAAVNLTGTMFGSAGPRVGSWLAVLYPQLTDRSAAYRILLNTAPLIRYKLVRLLGNESAPLSQRELCGEPSLLSHVLSGPAPGLPEVLIGLAELINPPDISLGAPDVLAKEFWQILDFHLQGHGLMRVLHLPLLRGRTAVPMARLIAARLGRPVIVLDLNTVEDDFEAPVAVTLREARLRNGIALFNNALSVGDEEPNPRRLLRVAQRWRRALALEQDVVLFGCEGENTNELHLLEQVGLDVSSYKMERLSYQQRRRLFGSGLIRVEHVEQPGQPAVHVSRDISVEQLASNYRVDFGDVDAIVHHAAVFARLRSASDGQPPEIAAEDVYKAARERTRRDLGKFARRQECRYTWADLVLPEDIHGRLYDFYTAAVNRSRVYDEWGYGRKHVRGRGLCAIFSGESGTGKTMSAEVLAGSLGVDLYQVDISTVVSKWVGETERNLSQIFDATEGSDAILFFDEADSLFGKRTKVKDSKDRYANMEVSYLLQRIEQYDGVVILASNMRSNIDEAFLRRFQFGIFYPQPDEAARLAIWRLAFPPEVPRSGLNFQRLARVYDELSGGQIRTVAIGAALLAAGENSPVTMVHIERSMANEMHKLQRLVQEPPERDIRIIRSALEHHQEHEEVS